MLHTFHITVSGKVQGVFYRQSACEKAKELGITGFVRNLPDGKVEIVATGTRQQLETLAAWCRQGPPRSRVTDVKTEKLETKHFDQFHIER